MKWRRDRREQRLQAKRDAVSRLLQPLTLSPWRMRVAIVAQYLAMHMTRALLKAVTMLAKFALVRKESR